MSHIHRVTWKFHFVSEPPVFLWVSHLAPVRQSLFHTDPQGSTASRNVQIQRWLVKHDTDGRHKLGSALLCKSMLTAAALKCVFVYQHLSSMTARLLSREPNTCSPHSDTETPGFWSKWIPSWRTSVMNGPGWERWMGRPLLCAAPCSR